MRIGISTSVIQRGKTGIAEYIFSLLRALLAHDGAHHLTIFALEQDLPLFEFTRSKAELVVVPEKFRSPIRDIFWHQFALPRLARHHRLDVLHVPSYRRLLWPKPCALVGTVHDLAAFHVARKYDRKRMWYGKVVAGHLARRQDAIIAVSHHTMQDVFRFWGVPADRVAVIYHGIDHERFSPHARTAAQISCRERFGLEPPYFLYVARLEHPAKNHIRLVQAFDLARSKIGSRWKLVFAGSDWHGAEAIHQAIDHASARHDIYPLGFVSDADLPLLYRAADAFVYPSLHEGFGFPPLQAMASGCPVVCSPCGALDEIVGEAALKLNPRDTGQMAEQLARLAGDVTLRDMLAQRGLARARQFDWQHAAIETLELYTRAFERAQERGAGRHSPANAIHRQDCWPLETQR